MALGRVAAVSSRGIAGFAAVVALLAAACGGGTPSASRRQPSPATTAPAPSTSPRNATTTTTPGAAMQAQRFFAVPTPAGMDPARFGRDVAVTTAKDGRPVVVFAVAPSTPGSPYQIVSATFDDASSAFKPTVDVASASLQDLEGSISADLDEQSGAIVAAWDDSGAIKAAVTRDEGATWQPFAVAAGRSPSVAAAAGKVGIAFVGADGQPALATTDLEGAPATVVPLPAAPDGPAYTSAPPSVAATSDGRFGVAAIASGEVRYIAPGATAPVTVASGDPARNPAPSVALSYADDQPVVAATFCTGPSTSCVIVRSYDPQGKPLPAVIPDDGGAGPGFITRLVTAGGGGAVAYLSNTAGRAERCGEPKLSLSRDRATWHTCSPDADRSLRLESGVPALGASPDGELVVAFQQTNRNAGAPIGVLVVIYGAAAAGGTSPL